MNRLWGLASSAPDSNLYNSRLGTYSYRLPLGPNIYNRLPQGQAQIFTTAYRLAGTTTAAVLWQLVRQNNPKSNLVPGGHQIRFLESHDAAVLWQLARQNNPKSNLVPGGAPNSIS